MQTNKPWRMLARLGKYGKNTSFFFPHTNSCRELLLSGKKCVSVFLRTSFCLSELGIFLGWSTKAHSDLHLKKGRLPPLLHTSIWTLMVLRHWAAKPVWTHANTHTESLGTGQCLHWRQRWDSLEKLYYDKRSHTWTHWRHVSWHSNTGLSLCASVSWIYLYTLLIRNQGQTLTLLYKQHCI